MLRAGSGSKQSPWMSGLAGCFRWCGAAVCGVWHVACGRNAHLRKKLCPGIPQRWVLIRERPWGRDGGAAKRSGHQRTASQMMRRTQLQEREEVEASKGEREQVEASAKGAGATGWGTWTRRTRTGRIAAAAAAAAATAVGAPLVGRPALDSDRGSHRPGRRHEPTRKRAARGYSARGRQQRQAAAEQGGGQSRALAVKWRWLADLMEVSMTSPAVTLIRVPQSA